MIRPMMIPLLAGLALVASPALARSSADGAGVAASVALADVAATLQPNRFVWQDDEAAGPVSVVVSIADQKAYVYRGQTMVAASTVSTGRAGNDTPVGTFTILQKAEVHHSNLYDAAPMPFMQRLTWDGVALHAGRNPGYADSHGCVRLPAAFARKLFAATKLGAQVTVTDMPVTTDFVPEPFVPDAELTQAANREAMIATR